jgi:hypothetical protein
MNFDTMPTVGISVMLTGVTTQTVRSENDYFVLDFDIDEYLGELEPKNFWLEVKHKNNNRYLTNKTGSINQNSRSTTAILVGEIQYIPPIINDLITNVETSPYKFVLNLEDISLVNNNNRTNNNQIVNAPWLNARQNHLTRGASPRIARKRSTNAPPNQPSTLATVLNSNPLPNMDNSNSQPELPELPEQSKPPTRATRATRTTK